MLRAIVKKRKFFVFWSIIAAGGMIPAIAQAVTAGPAPASAPAPTVSNPPAAPPATAQAPSDSPAKYLSKSEASGVIDGLQISVLTNGGNKSAVLTGLYPPACAGKFTIESTATSGIQSSIGIKGFVVHDNGGFVSCVQKNGGASYCENTANVCASLSQITQSQGQADPSIVLPANETVSVAYLDKQNNDAALGDNWSPDQSSLLESKSEAEIQDERDTALAAAKERHEEALQKAILVCAESRSTIDDATSALKHSGLSEDEIQDLQTKITQQQQQFDDKDLAALRSKAKTAINNSKTDQFDELESEIYHYYNKHKNRDTGDSSLSDDQKGALAQMIYDMAGARTEADGATSEDLNKAEEMLTRAMDSDHGLGLSDKNQQTFQAAIDEKIPEARVNIAYRACAEGTYNLQYQESTMQRTYAMNPYGTMNSINSTAKSAQNSCKSANKLYDNELNAINKKMRDNHCSNVSTDTSVPNLFGGSSSSSDSGSGSSSSVCQDLAQQEQNIQKGISDVTQNVQEQALQQIQSMSSQLPSLPSLGSMGMGMGMGQQMPQSMMSPTASMFSNPMASSYGYAGAPTISSNGMISASPMTQPGMIAGGQYGTPYYNGYTYQSALR